MSISCFNACLKPFAKWQYSFINWALWQVRSDRLQDGLQLQNVRWLRYIVLVLVKHRTPHMIVKRVEIRRIRWPLFLPDKLWAITAKPVLRQWCCVSRPVAKLFFFSSDSCNFCFMWMIWEKFSENTVVFLSIIWCKFQEFKLHGFREIEFFLGGCFFMPHPVYCFDPVPFFQSKPLWSHLQQRFHQ